MKPILVLGPARPGAPALERLQVDVYCTAQIGQGVADCDSYSSVIVINDGGADAVRRVLMAEGLRARRPGLCVGTLFYLQDAALRGVPWAGVPTGAPSVNGLQRQRNIEPRLTIGSNGDALIFEYSDS